MRRGELQRVLPVLLNAPRAPHRSAAWMQQVAVAARILERALLGALLADGALDFGLRLRLLEARRCDGLLQRPQLSLRLRLLARAPRCRGLT